MTMLFTTKKCDYTKIAFKIILIGDSGVGKSCLLLKFLENKFNNQHDITIGVDFGTRNIRIENTTIALQIWDTAGAESFRSITRSYYRGAAIALLCVDMTHQKSYNNAESWLHDLDTYCSPNTEIFLVGTKSDNHRDQVVSESDLQGFATAHNIGCVICSARGGVNVEEAFAAPVRKILHDIKQDHAVGEAEPHSVDIAHRGESRRSSQCC